MKHKLITLLFLFICLKSFCQSLILPDAKELSVIRSETDDVKTTLNFKIFGREKDTKLSIIVIDKDEGTADLGKDYYYAGKSTTPPVIPDLEEGKSQAFAIEITIAPKKIGDGKKTIIFYVTFFRGKEKVSEKVTLTFDDGKPKTSSVADTSKWYVHLITGASFDFFDSPAFKNFAGELKVYVPLLDGKTFFGKKRTFGFQTGIFNYHYYESDSSNGNIQFENYMLDPTTRIPIVNQTKYVRSIFALNSTTTYNNLGAYFDPMVLMHKSDWWEWYLDLHFEGIWRTTTSSTIVVPIRKDTLTFTQSDSAQRLVLGAFPGIRPLYTRFKNFDFYFGIGAPMRVNIKNIFLLYLEPTIGITNYSLLNRSIQTENNISHVIINQTNGITFYDLMKFQLVTTVAPVDIVVGGEVRAIAKKQLDSYPVFYAFYLGAIIPLKK